MIKKQLSDLVVEHAKKALDTQTKIVLYGVAHSLKETEGKEAKKGRFFKGARDPEALACFFFALLLMHNPSFAL